MHMSTRPCASVVRAPVTSPRHDGRQMPSGSEGEIFHLSRCSSGACAHSGPELGPRGHGSLTYVVLVVTHYKVSSFAGQMLRTLHCESE